MRPFAGLPCQRTRMGVMSSWSPDRPKPPRASDPPFSTGGRGNPDRLACLARPCPRACRSERTIPRQTSTGPEKANHPAHLAACRRHLGGGGSHARRTLSRRCRDESRGRQRAGRAAAHLPGAAQARASPLPRRDPRRPRHDGSPPRRQARQYLALTSEGLNTLELDVKDENGEVGFRAKVPLARQIGFGSRLLRGQRGGREGRAKGVYLIGR